MGKKSGPPAPDYTGAANAQAQASKDTAVYNTWADRPNVTTPWGSQTWTNQTTTDPTTGQKVTQWNQNISLSPQEQASLDSQFAVQQGRSQAAQEMLGQATQSLQRPMDWGGMPARAGNISAPNQLSSLNFDAAPANSSFSNQYGLPTDSSVARTSFSNQYGLPGDSSVARTSFSNQYQLPTDTSVANRAFSFGGNLQYGVGDPNGYRQRAQDAVSALQQPMLEQRRKQTEQQLANQGLAVGSEAYTNAMRDVNDAETRAGLMAIDAGRQEAAQQFGQNLQAGQFNNNTVGQAYQQALGQANFENQAQQQEFANQLGLNQIGYQQALGQANFENQAQQQEFANQMGLNQAGYQQAMGQAGFENQAQQQMFSNLMARAQAGDQQAMQLLQMQMQAGGFNNNNRTSAIAEAQQQRQMPLNELNALLTGQQVQMPNMPGFASAARAQAPDLMGATSAQYDASLNNYNARQGFMNNMTQLGGQLGSMFLFSDVRLKTDIQPAGYSIGGVPVVHYRYRGLPGRHVGVIAQEVAKVKPSAVALHPSGYLVVNYGELL